MLRHPKIPSVYFAVALAGCVLNAIAQHSQKYISFMRQTIGVIKTKLKDSLTKPNRRV